MIVWRGCGILVVVLTAAACMAAMTAAKAVWGDPLSEALQRAAMVCGMLVSAVLVYGVHRAVKRRGTLRTSANAITGLELTRKAQHDLLFMPMHVWSFALAAMGMCLLFKS